MTRARKGGDDEATLRAHGRLLKVAELPQKLLG